jgi:DNA polymerase-3 subunit delta'
MTTWDDVIGHDWAADVLRNAIQYDRIGQSYLITGPAQVGKSTLARVFAQALNCTAANPEERPCGRCRSCSLIAAGRHPDVQVVTGEVSGRGITTLKIDQIRELMQQLSLTAAEARYKVAILKGFETANPSAANAFLKTLEEPPSNVVLILTAADADTLLPTITSRCRVIALRPLNYHLVEESLIERWGVEPELARLLARLSDGRLGWAVKTAQNPVVLEIRADQLQQLYEALAGSRVDRFILAEELCKKPELLPELLQTWLSWWRDCALLGVGGRENGTLTNFDQKSQMLDLLENRPVSEAVNGLRQTGLAIWQLEHNANSRLVMENLLLRYPFRLSG